MGIAPHLLQAILAALPLKSIGLTIDTNKAVGTGVRQFRLPLVVTGTYRFVVSWGDGNKNVITSWNQPEVTHLYTNHGVYPITITGVCLGWAFANGGDRLKLTGVTQWGESVRFDRIDAFQGCTNLTAISAIDEPYVVPGSNIAGMFLSCTGLTSVPASLWPNLPKSTISISNLFQYDAALASFTGIGSWDVSDVQFMNSTFYGCPLFTEDLNGWDVGSVTEMRFMLQGTGGIVGGSHPLTLDAWDTSNLTKLDGFLESATWGAVNLAGWDVSKVTTLEKFMYACAYAPTLDTTGWDTSAVTNMSQTFQDATLFNSPVNHWDVSNVTDMYQMFRGTAFNQTLASWNVEKVTTMDGMFRSSSFKQDIGMWWPKSCTSFDTFLYPDVDINSPDSATNQDNYDALLVGWTGWSGGAAGAKGLALQPNVLFDGGSSQYSAGSDAADARAWLIATKGWTFNDGGPA